MGVTAEKAVGLSFQSFLSRRKKRDKKGFSRLSLTQIHISQKNRFNLEYNVRKNKT